MATRAKFRCTKKTQLEGVSNHIIELTAQYDDSIPEDQRFAKATPSGKFEMQVTVQAAADLFVPGKTYYLDLTPAE